MTASVDLLELTLFVTDVDAAALFYEAVGVALFCVDEPGHPRHYDGELGLQLWPASDRYPVSSVQLGFVVNDLPAVVVRLDAIGAPWVIRTECRCRWPWLRLPARANLAEQRCDHPEGEVQRHQPRADTEQPVTPRRIPEHAELDQHDLHQRTDNSSQHTAQDRRAVTEGTPGDRCDRRDQHRGRNRRRGVHHPGQHVGADDRCRARDPRAGAAEVRPATPWRCRRGPETRRGCSRGRGPIDRPAGIPVCPSPRGSGHRRVPPPRRGQTAGIPPAVAASCTET